MAKKHDIRKLEAALKFEKEARLCGAGCSYFINRYVYIEDPDTPGGVIPFKLWPAQEEVLATILNERLIIALKARQLGLTWLALAYAVWRCLFVPGYRVVLLSQGEDEAKELIRRVEFILRYLPPWLTREHNKQTAKLGLPTWQATTEIIEIYHGNKQAVSRMKALPASPRAGRSLTGSLVIIDEWASQEYAEKIWRAAFPTINRPTGGQVIGISTGEEGTLFEAIWDDAERGKNDFIPVFLPWNADPRRDKEWYESTRRNMEIQRARGEKVNFYAEYPSTPREAFMHSGNHVFNVEAVAERLRKLYERYEKEPPLRGNLVCEYNEAGDPLKGTIKFQPDPQGWLTIYEESQPGTPYVIGGDIAEDGSNWSIGQVIDNITCKQVATWRARLESDLYAKQMFMLGHYYNEALIAIEVNFDLHPVKELRRLRYTKQYRRELIDDITEKRQHRDGFKTTQLTRGPLISGLIAFVRDNLHLINDITTLEEMLTFVRNKQGKPEAKSGKYDDAILALAIAHAARDQQTMKKAVTPQGLTGTYFVGELKLMGMSDWQIRRLARQGGVKILGLKNKALGGKL